MIYYSYIDVISMLIVFKKFKEDIKMNMRYGFTDIIFDLNQARKAREAQYAIRKYGFQEKNEGLLISGLSFASSVLSLVFTLPTPVTLAAGVIGLATSAMETELQSIIRQCRDGEDSISDMIDLLRSNPDWKQIKIKFPTATFLDQNFRILIPKPTIIAIRKNNGGWITA